MQGGLQGEKTRPSSLWSNAYRLEAPFPDYRKLEMKEKPYR